MARFPLDKSLQYGRIPSRIQVWIGAPDTVLRDLVEEVLHDTLSIPLNVRIPALVAIGHPAEELPPHGRHDRFVGTKVHYGKWGELKQD